MEFLLSISKAMSLSVNFEMGEVMNLKFADKADPYRDLWRDPAKFHAIDNATGLIGLKNRRLSSARCFEHIVPEKSDEHIIPYLLLDCETKV